jgi:excisionase family DNA binding protein
MPEKHPTMTVREAANRLHVSLRQIYALIWDGRLDGQKVDGQWRISARAVEERLSQRAGSR